MLVMLGLGFVLRLVASL